MIGDEKMIDDDVKDTASLLARLLFLQGVLGTALKKIILMTVYPVLPPMHRWRIIESAEWSLLYVCDRDACHLFLLTADFPFASVQRSTYR